jgi:hypothetical protein
MHLPEKFRAAIEEGVRDIADGELRKLNPDEKRRLLAILRKLDDCPDGWKNKKNMTPKKQQSILNLLHKAIDRLVNPEKVKAARKKFKESGQRKAANARSHKKRKENGKAQEHYERNNAKNKENGQQKIWNAKNNAKTSAKIREANARAILENKDHKEPTWDEDTIEKEATEKVEMIVDKCGRNGFVHVFVGAWPGKNLKEAVEAECFGKGRNRHAVFIDDGKFVRYHHVSDHVKLLIPYTGTNCLNADELEKRVQKKLIDMGWPAHRRMFRVAGAGSCKGKREAKIPFPYYTGVLVCAQSMEEIGIRLATEKDRAPKRKRSSSSSSSSSL